MNVPASPLAVTAALGTWTLGFPAGSVAEMLAVLKRWQPGTKTAIPAALNPDFHPPGIAGGRKLKKQKS